MGESNIPQMAVSVIIPTRNEGEFITESLASVFNQSVKPLEVIVVDGRSTDNTVERAKQFPVKIVTEEIPTSLPNARNLGVKEAKGQVVFIMDADVVLLNDCIKNALKYFVDSNVIAVTPNELSIPHTRIEKIQMDWIRGTANPIRTGFGLSVFAKFFRKDIFDSISFDPSLGYGEDDDFGRRLKKLFPDTGRILRAKESEISPHHSHSLKELWSQYRWYGRTFGKYFPKNPSVKMMLNFMSFLFPILVLVTLFVAFVFPQALFLLILFSGLFITRNLLACYRVKSKGFFYFIGFEFIRSASFLDGIFQNLLKYE